MVDVASAFARRSADGSEEARPSDAATRSFALVEAADFSSLQAYRRLCGKAHFAPPQDPRWLAAFAAASPDMLIATLSRDGMAAMALALEVVRAGPFRVARFVGGRHANGNFPAVREALAPAVDRQSLGALFQAIATARPDIDALVLERQAASLDGISNPLCILPNAHSPNVALAVDLDGGFDALLDRASGKRKRKKHRSQTRKFEAAGGSRRIEARTPQEVDRVLDAFFAMKRERFRKMGVSDVFGPHEIQTAFRTLFKSALSDKRPPFILHALEVGGSIRAVTGSSRTGRRIVCEFGAILEDELAHASPGEFLFFDNIREACEEGCAVYDFSVGDEPYKRLWCDIETAQFDVLAPLTLKGRLLVGFTKAAASAKRFVKTNPVIWSLVKRIRKRAASGTSPSADDE